MRISPIPPSGLSGFAGNAVMLDRSRIFDSIRNASERRCFNIKGRCRMAKEPAAFKSHWPEGVKESTFYRVPCDDKGAKGGAYLQVMIASDGDVHVSMQDWEDIPNGHPDPLPSVRISTIAGGGRNMRTRQALLWLADAIRRDAEEHGPYAG
jgi:hypothetical protein